MSGFKRNARPAVCFWRPMSGVMIDLSAVTAIVPFVDSCDVHIYMKFKANDPIVVRCASPAAADLCATRGCDLLCQVLQAI